MYKMQLMIDTLQTEELDVSAALLVMAETKESLEHICKDESGVNNEVQAACSFAKQFDVDAELVVREAEVQKYMSTYHIEGQFHFALKLPVTCLI